MANVRREAFTSRAQGEPACLKLLYHVSRKVRYWYACLVLNDQASLARGANTRSSRTVVRMF